MVGVALALTLVAGGMVAWASLRRGPSLGFESLAAALETWGLKLELVAASWPRFASKSFLARSTIGGQEVKIRLDSEGPGRAPRVTLQLEAHLDPRFSLQIHFGEQTWWVLGDETLAAALATERVRCATGPGDQLHISDGLVALLTRDPAGAGEGIAALQELSLRLSRTASPSVDRLLEETAFYDRSPRARAEAAQHLLLRNPESAHRLSFDSAPEVRLAVARAVRGDRGFELAAEILTSEIFNREMQQAALRYLVKAHGADQVGPVLVGALGAADDGLQGAIVTALSALGHGGASEALRCELPTAELRNAARIAEALVRLEGQAAEPALLSLFDRLPSSGPVLPDERELAAAVADALGQVGTKACLPRLRSLAAVVSPDGAVGIAAKVALDLVRARTGAFKLSGALALATTTRGEGSLSSCAGP